MTPQPAADIDATPTWSGRHIVRLLVLVGLALGMGILWSRRHVPPSPSAPLAPAAPDLAFPARELMQQGDFEGALKVTDALLAERPDDVETLLLHSEVLFRLYRSDEMIPHLEHALALQPVRFEVHANLAFALRFAGRLDDAEREVQWCLARQPHHAAVRRVLGEIRRDQGNHAAALSEVRMALRAAPQDLECRLLEADLLLFARDFETAYQGLLPLREEHGHNGRYLSALARAAQLSGRGGEAKEYQALLERLNAAN